MAGKWFDELEVGQVFKHAIRRTLTETDNILFTSMTHNPAQLHLDADYCEKHTESVSYTHLTLPTILLV